LHFCTCFLSAVKQDSDGYVPQQLDIRLFQKIQEHQAKFKEGTEEKEEKTSKNKTKGQASKVAQGLNDKNIKQSPQARRRTAETEEKELRDAYKVLLTEYNKRKARRNQNPKKQSEQKQADKQSKEKQEDEPIQDDFSHLRHKNLSQVNM